MRREAYAYINVQNERSLRDVLNINAFPCPSMIIKKYLSVEMEFRGIKAYIVYIYIYILSLIHISEPTRPY